jgi:hypothetical protein
MSIFKDDKIVKYWNTLKIASNNPSTNIEQIRKVGSKPLKNIPPKSHTLQATCKAYPIEWASHGQQQAIRQTSFGPNMWKPQQIFGTNSGPLYMRTQPIKVFPSLKFFHPSRFFILNIFFFLQNYYALGNCKFTEWVDPRYWPIPRVHFLHRVHLFIDGLERKIDNTPSPKDEPAPDDEGENV